MESLLTDCAKFLAKIMSQLKNNAIFVTKKYALQTSFFLRWCAELLNYIFPFLTRNLNSMFAIITAAAPATSFPIITAKRYSLL